MKFRIGSSATLRYYTLTFCGFALLYVLSNFEVIRSAPRFSGPMFGSLAQFTFPYACAAGTYLALSSEALGLYVHERLATRNVLLRQGSELGAFLLAGLAALSLLGIFVAGCHLWMGIPPQIPLRYLLYPIGFLVAGAGVGLAVGHVLLRWARPRRLSVVILTSFAVGFNVFLHRDLSGEHLRR